MRRLPPRSMLFPYTTLFRSGSVQGVADILFLKGVDLGIVRSDTLEYLEKKGYANRSEGTRLNTSHVRNSYADFRSKKTINSLPELEGKTVAVDLPNGGTFVT